MQFIEPPAYRKAFIQYLRRGTPLELSLKAIAEEKPITHYIWRTSGDDKVRPSHAVNNGRILATLLRRIRDVDAETLNEVQARNLRRFDQKLLKDAGEIQIIRGADSQRIFRADVPARNIPGSYARYEKVVDKLGNTVSYNKTTYAPDGRIVHIKIK